MNDLAIMINYDADCATVLGRELHSFLRVETALQRLVPEDVRIWLRRRH